MFVRWKRRQRVGTSRRRRGKPGVVLLSAQLVRSVRREGKPRQEVVAYLGSIEEGRVGEFEGRFWFWRVMGRVIVGRIDALGLEPAERRRVLDALEAVVAPPTAAELAEAFPEVYGPEA
jgi:hypothetical protein